MVSNGVSILEHNIHLAQLFPEETVITLADWYHQAAVTIEGQRPYVTLYYYLSAINLKITPESRTPL